MIVLVIIAVLCLFVLAVLDRRRNATELEGPRGVPFLGIALKLAFMPLDGIYPYIKEIMEEYGWTNTLNISGVRTAITAEPKDLEILLSSTSHIKKGNSYFVVRPWLREGLLLSEGAKWHQRRKLLTPTFHFKILEDSISRIAKHTEHFVERLLKTNGESFPIEDIVRNATLNVICETALGFDMKERNEQRNAYVGAIKSIIERATKWFYDFWLHNKFMFRLSALGRGYYKDLSVIYEFSEKIIRERKSEFMANAGLEEPATGKRYYAFLDRLLELNAKNSDILTVRDIQEEVDTFTFEGHDTTAAAVVYSLFVLANHQEVQDKVVDELMDIFGSDNRTPTHKDLNAMVYLEMVIKETLRLYPSVPVITRLLEQPLTLSSGKVIPAGFEVIVFVFFVHRHEDHWDEPEEFRPERFAPGIRRHPFAYIPFSAGPRNCIGQKFAMIELKMILSSVLRSCRILPVTTTTCPVTNIIMKSRDPIYIKVLPRK